MTKKLLASIAAILSGVLYGISVPLVKLVGSDSPSWTSALLYFGAGVAMVFVAIVIWLSKKVHVATGSTFTARETPFTRKYVPLLAGMVALDTAAALSLVSGISLSSASTASLLGNFEIVATAIFAWLIFREPLTKRMIAAITLLTAAGVLLSWTGDGVELSLGAVLIGLSCIFWGLENNCTRALSECNVVYVTMIKGFFTALVSFLIACVIGEKLVSEGMLPLVLIGAFSYGFSIVLYIWSQRYIGSAKTGNFYSIAPFVGVMASWGLFGFSVTCSFVVALCLSVGGVFLNACDIKHSCEKI